MEGRTGLPRTAADNGAERILICGYPKTKTANLVFVKFNVV